MPLLKLDTLHGPLLLRKNRSFSEKSVVPFDLGKFEYERALRKSASTYPLELWNLMRELSHWFPMAPSKEQLVALALEELRLGRLIAVRAGAEFDLDDKREPARRAFEVFRAKLGRDFQLWGRRFRLVARDHVDDARRVSDFDVVAAEAARELLARVGYGMADAEISSAVEVLSANIVDLRAPATQPGFVLLTVANAHRLAPVPVDEVLTPVRIKRLADRPEQAAWIDVEVVFEDGTSYDGVLSVRMADEKVQTWPVGGSATRFEPVPEGSVEGWLDVAD